MADPMSSLSPQKLNASYTADEDDMTWHDPPSSPFISHIETGSDQENIAPDAAAVAPTPVKQLIDFDDSEIPPQSAFKISPTKTHGLKERSASPSKSSKQLLDDFENDTDTFRTAVPEMRTSPKKSSSPVKQDVERRSNTPEGLPTPSQVKQEEEDEGLRENEGLTVAMKIMGGDNATSTPAPVSASASRLRDNEGLTVAMKMMEETSTTVTREESYEYSSHHQVQTDVTDLDDFGLDNTEFNPDGPDFTSVDVDDTCFSTFSEMPNLDMTKFAALRKSPTKTSGGLFDQATPRARTQMTPSTVRRSERTPSPTPRRQHKDNDTTNLLLDFTAQIEAFSASRRGSPNRTRASPAKSTTEPNLLSYIQNQRSPAKGGSSTTHIPSTPSQNRQLLNLLDFELPPPPTPRSVPTVTIRELESLKSTMQSQISSLSASLSGKEAEVESLVKAISGAERRVGEAQEQLRDERSAREHAESQMEDWKKKGEEVQKLLQDVQSELARNDTERESLLTRLAESEKRAEEAEARSTELETRAIEAESKNVDMTTFINPDDEVENKKVYSELECQAAIAEKVNDVARDLHTAYKAKHEKKIKALKENYQKKADERCKELRVQIIRLERQVEEAEKKRDDTFSKVLPPEFQDKDASASSPSKNNNTQQQGSNAEDLKTIEAQKSEIQNLRAKLAGLQSELSSLRQSQDTLMQELEAERVEKGELVAAAEQMLSLCGEKMGEMQQQAAASASAAAAASQSQLDIDIDDVEADVQPEPEPEQQELRKSVTRPAPTKNGAGSSMRSTGFLAGGGSGPTTSRPGSSLAAGRPGSALGDRLGAMSDKPSGLAKPSGLRAPGGGGGGFGFKGPGIARSNSAAAASKSRLMSNIERMGGGKAGGE